MATLNNAAAIGVAGWLALATIPATTQKVYATLPPPGLPASMHFVSGGTATVMLPVTGAAPSASGGIGSGSGDP